MEEFMKYAVEMGSGSMIYIKTGSGIQKLIMGDTYADTETHTDSMVIS
jgi:hypothetical protein